MNFCTRSFVSCLKNLKLPLSQRYYSSLLYSQNNVINGQKSAINKSKLSNYLKLYCTATSSTSSETSSIDPSHKSKENPNQEIPMEALIALDGGCRLWVPKFFSRIDDQIMHLLHEKVEFEDKIFGYKTKGRTQFLNHLLKLRIYFPIKSVILLSKHQGSYIPDEQDRVIFLWKLILQRHILSWAMYPTNKEKKVRYLEGAMEAFLTDIGDGYRVNKIVNRPITKEDRDQVMPYDHDITLHAEAVKQEIWHSCYHKRQPEDEEGEEPQEEEKSDAEKEAERKAQTPFKIDL